MFYHVRLIRKIRVHPSKFNRNISIYIEDQLHREVDGQCIEKYGGIVLTVTRLIKTGLGRLEDHTGYAVYNVVFMAIVCRPEKEETVCAMVTQVSQTGIITEAGPIQIFVSRRQMPDDMILEDTPQPTLSSPDGVIRIKKGTNIRLKIIGVQIDSQGIQAIGTVNQDYLGVFE